MDCSAPRTIRPGTPWPSLAFPWPSIFAVCWAGCQPDHDVDYVAAVARAEREQRLNDADSQRFNLGINGNLIFGEVFRRPAIACGLFALHIAIIAYNGRQQPSLVARFAGAGARP